jgi:hypothetical protein
MVKKISILQEESSLNKFCIKENKVFGCQDNYGCRIACPLWRARYVEYLVNEKGMTIGEAHRASLRLFLDDKATRESLMAMFDSKKECISMKELIDVIERSQPCK